jgi:hypothetical protein
MPVLELPKVEDIELPSVSVSVSGVVSLGLLSIILLQVR